MREAISMQSEQTIQRAIEIGDIAPASTKGNVAIHSTRLRTCV